MKQLLNKLAMWLNQGTKSIGEIEELRVEVHKIAYIPIEECEPLEMMIPYATFRQGDKVEDELDYIIEILRIEEWLDDENSLGSVGEKLILSKLCDYCNTAGISLIRFW